MELLLNTFQLNGHRVEFCPQSKRQIRHELSNVICKLTFVLFLAF